MWQLALIGGLLGGAAGLGGTRRNLRRQQDALRRQQEAAKKQYQHAKDLGDRQWGIQKGEAASQSRAQERALREGVGQFTGEYNAAMLERAFGEQDARIQNAASAGMSRVQEGLGGARGGAAGELMRAYADASLERGIGLQRDRDARALANTAAGADRAAQEIGRERDSWGAGGWRYESKAAQDQYNLDIYDLGQQEYQYAVEQSDPGNLRANGWDYVAGAFGGAATGLGMAYGAYQLDQNSGGKIGNWFNSLFKGGGKAGSNSIFGADNIWGSIFDPQTGPMFSSPVPGLNMDFWTPKESVPGSGPVITDKQIPFDISKWLPKVGQKPLFLGGEWSW